MDELVVDLGFMVLLFFIIVLFSDKELWGILGWCLCLLRLYCWWEEKEDDVFVVCDFCDGLWLLSNFWILNGLLFDVGFMGLLIFKKIFIDDVFLEVMLCRLFLWLWNLFFIRCGMFFVILSFLYLFGGGRCEVEFVLFLKIFCNFLGFLGCWFFDFFFLILVLEIDGIVKIVEYNVGEVMFCINILFFWVVIFLEVVDLKDG